MTHPENAECKSFTEATDIRSFPQGKLALMQIGGATVGRAVFEPGWSWSTSVQPLANTATCLAPHFQYHVKGVLHIVMDDGTEFDCKPGDISYLPMGHLAWTVGDEAVEVIDFQGMIDYAEQQRAKAEKTLNRLIMQSPLPMLVFEHDVENINPLSNQNFRDLIGFSCAKALSNQRFQDILGFTAEEITELSDWWNLAFPNEAYRLQVMHEWSTKLQESSQCESSVEPSTVKIQLKNGEIRLFQVHLSRVETQSIAVFVDLTEQARHNAELEQAKQAADQANQAKSEFLANMSHELRTPLNGILGYAQILGRSKTLSGKEQNGINIIHQCGSHLLTLINDILDLSKIEARKLELDPSTLHLPALLRSVVEMCQIRAEQKGVCFDHAFAADLPEGVIADGKRLRQVLINLLGNAIKFTDCGSVSFKVERLTAEPFSPASPDALSRISTDSSKLRIRFTVADTGVGIAPDQIEAIFQPFEQVGSASKQTEGTGLGLAISQQIVRLMGGQIQVKSQLGIGSEFFFEVDVPTAIDWSQQQAAAIGHIVGYAGDRRHILVIDDRWENRAVLVNFLEPLGFQVSEARNGQEGLEKAAQINPDLIITDIAMPVMDGCEFLQRLRADAQLSQHTVIVSSASVAQPDRQMSLDAGGDDFLAKPVQAEELFGLLQQYLSLTWISEAAAPQDPPEPVPLTEIMVPQRADLENLLMLARQGRLKKLMVTAEQIQAQDDRYRPFIQQILPLAKAFQATKIMQFIESYL